MDNVTTSRSDQLTTALRRRIVAGEFAPGARLPTFQEIEETFSVSRGVAQMAIQRLKEDGFVNASSRQGMFVVRHPPHLRRYGIVFPVTHADPAWSRFDEVFVRESRLLQEVATQREFEIFAGTADRRTGPEVLARLRREVAADRLAGLILTPGSFELAARAPFNDPALPKALVFHYPGDAPGSIVGGDGESIVNRSLACLASQGCRRVAVIRAEGAYSSVGEAHFAKAGLKFHSQWLQVIGRGDTIVLSTLIPLLMDYPANQRPDGLFILDDNLVDHVTSAVVATGLRIGTDIKIVAHSNWPSRSPTAVPIRRIGYHVGHMLARCIDAIDAQRQGKTPPSVQLVPAMFEDEIDPA